MSRVRRNHDPIVQKASRASGLQLGDPQALLNLSYSTLELWRVRFVWKSDSRRPCDIVVARLPASSLLRVRAPLSRRAQSPGARQPVDRRRAVLRRRRCSMPPTPRRVAEVLRPSCLSLASLPHLDATGLRCNHLSVGEALRRPESSDRSCCRRASAGTILYAITADARVEIPFGP